MAGGKKEEKKGIGEGSVFGKGEEGGGGGSREI